MAAATPVGLRVPAPVARQGQRQAGIPLCVRVRAGVWRHRAAGDLEPVVGCVSVPEQRPLHMRDPAVWLLLLDDLLRLRSRWMWCYKGRDWSSPAADSGRCRSGVMHGRTRVLRSNVTAAPGN